jgi:ArsR family transcriptional regulator
MTTLHAPDTLALIERLTDRLIGRAEGAVADEAVHEIVVDSLRRYRHLDHPSSHARSLAAQLAADRVDALLWLARHDGGTHPTSVLFVCSGNAGRSQIAAAVMRAMTPSSTRVVSAGDRPTARILPAVIEALDEIGIPAFGEYPKPVTPELVAAADHVVVLNCDDRLDELEGRAFRTWSILLESTSGKQGMRRTRDEIADSVRALAVELGLVVRAI